MKPKYQTDKSTVIVYDADQLDHVESAYFDRQYWEERDAVVGQATGGRGITWFVQQSGKQWALRHYRRGGLVAQFATDRYLWLGLKRTRAWREWHLMADLNQLGLPVPVPVAARIIRTGFSYQADLIMHRITDVEQLTQRLQLSALPHDDWRRLGGLLRSFHDAGLDHADLNSDNILLSPRNQFWLIDFDQARLRVPGRWQQDNLLRLKRSLDKRQGKLAQLFWTDTNWAELRAGYDDSQAGG